MMIRDGNATTPPPPPRQQTQLVESHNSNERRYSSPATHILGITVINKTKKLKQLAREKHDTPSSSSRHPRGAGFVDPLVDDVWRVGDCIGMTGLASHAAMMAFYKERSAAEVALLEA